MVLGAGAALTRIARRRLLRSAAWRRTHETVPSAPPPPSAAALAAAEQAAAAYFEHQAALWRLAARALDSFRGTRAGTPAPLERQPSHAQGLGGHPD
eukprot:6961414-Alexandrium_andersonii.AAC.1